MGFPTRRKDPGAVLDYGFDWSEWLESGETITDSSWTVPDGLTQEAIDQNDTTTTIRLSGGTAGQTYQITNHVTTSDSQEDERSFCLVVVER